MREEVFLGVCAVLAFAGWSCSSDSSTSRPAADAASGGASPHADGASPHGGAGSGGRANHDSGHLPDASPAPDGSAAGLDAASAQCMPHASGATATPVDGTGRVASAKTYGGSRITGASLLGAETFVTSEVDPGTTTYGGKPIAGAGALSRIVVADLDSSGAVKWVVGAAFDGEPSFFETSLTATASGLTVLLAGAGPITFGGTAIGVVNEKALGIATVSLTGTVTNFAALSFPAQVIRAAFGPSGDLYLFGGFDPGKNTDGGLVICSSPTATAYGVARVTTGGVAVWTRCFGGAYKTADVVAVDGAEHVYISGFPAPNPDFGGGPLVLDNSAGAGAIVELGQNGAFLRVERFLRLYADILAVHPDGTLFVSGDMPQESAVNGLMEYAGVRYLPCKTGGFQSHVTRLDPDGHVAWSRAFGVRPNRLLVLPDKSVVFDTTGIDGPTADGLSQLDRAVLPALVLLTPTGDVHWVQTFGDKVSNTRSGLTLGPYAASATDIVAGGTFDGTLTLGAPLVAPQTGSDVLIRFNP